MISEPLANQDVESFDWFRLYKNYDGAIWIDAGTAGEQPPPRCVPFTEPTLYISFRPQFIGHEIDEEENASLSRPDTTSE
jgi:hypothetical protein